MYKLIYISMFIFSIPFILFFISSFIHYIYFYVKGYRIQRKKEKEVREPFFLYKIFVLFPRQYVLDLFNRDPYEFNEYGVHFVAGKQGAGKTLFVTWYLDYLKNKYPKVKIMTNYNYLYQDKEINKWEDLVYYNNGEYGVVKVIDELQNWFSSNQSKNFPPEMLTEITQQRKQRSMILATGQVFGRVAKPLREQVFFLYKPFTILGSLTFVIMTEPELNEAAEVVKNRYRKLFIIPHTKRVRESFDTYKKIQDLSKDGFHERNFDSGVTSVLEARGKAKRRRK